MKEMLSEPRDPKSAVADWPTITRRPSPTVQGGLDDEQQREMQLHIHRNIQAS